jgi:hypothetical protein
MLFSDSHILSTILFTPLIGAILMLFIPRERADLHRSMGNLFGFLGLLVSLPLIWRFQSGPGAPQFQFVENASWIPSVGAHFTLGIDGLSFLMVMLTTVLGAIAILSSWSAIHKREKEYYILLLLLQTGMLGVFMSLDFVLFYVFWEVMLVPMYFLIGVWGSERRLYAAIKFFLYTLAGSVLMLLAILAIYYYRNTFDMREILTHPFTAQFGWLQKWLFWGFFFAFAIKVPMFPFHTWLPHPGRRAVENGDVRFPAIFAADVSRRDGEIPRHRDCALADWDYLRGAGLHDAEGHEEAHRVFVGEPHGILHAGDFRAHAAGAFRQHHPANQSWHFHRRAVPAGGRTLRAAAHAADFGIWRTLDSDAEFCGGVFDHNA